MTTSAVHPPRARATRSDAYEDGRQHPGPCGHLLPCGCSGVAPCCFHCPLPKCRFDAGGRLDHQLAAHRQDQARLLSAKGHTPNDIARQLHISLRTAFRLLAP